MKQILCSFCLLNGDMIQMQEKAGYYKCPACEAELWADDVVFRNVKQKVDNSRYISRSLPEGVQIHGGEKKQGKSSLAQKMQKDSLSKLNTLLYKNR